MSGTEMRERLDRRHRGGGRPFGLTVSKLLPPLVQRGTIGRLSLLDRLANGDPRRIVSVVAPPGYGKTTLLSQWAERSGTAFAWVSVDERDNDPGVLLADPVTEAWAALAQAILCRRGVGQMRADADEAARKFAAQNIVAGAQLCQGLARIFSGDLDGGDARLEEAVSLAAESGAPEAVALALCERALLAMARGDWSRAEDLAGQTSAALSQAGMEHLLACAVQARLAMQRGDIAAARHELINAQRLRPMVTYAHPYLAVQARIELARVHLALAEPAGARTLMREIDEVLKRRPDLGTLVGEAHALRARLAAERASGTQGALSLTTAELRVLPMLATHLSFPEIGAEMSLSPHTVKSQAMSIYRKLGASSRHQAVTRSRDLGLLEG
jgi:LuxR family transcriptional regulator, maltose regulon positive regulatory protein